MILSEKSVVKLELIKQKLNEDSFIVGNINENKFFEVSEEFTYIMEFADGNNSIHEIRDRIKKEYFVDIDIKSAMEELLGENLIYFVDGVIIGCNNNVHYSKCLKLFANIFFSNRAIMIYWMLFFINIAMMLYNDIYPSTADVLIIENKPGLSLLLFFIISWGITFFHEIGHFIAAVKLDIPVKVRLSFRIIFLVVETDINAIWAVPSKSRNKCYLAGFFVEMIILFAVLCVGIFIGDNPKYANFMNATMLIIFINFVRQFMIFVRSDLYFIILNKLKISSLHDEAMVLLKNKFKKNDEHESIEKHSTVIIYAFIYVLGFIFSIIYYSYNMLIYYHIILEVITQIRYGTENTIDIAMLCSILFINSLLWIVGLYSRFKQTTMIK